ncbi:MAG: hypothetical protein ACYC1S_11770 [Gemmatimonadaceae bacterium]
MADRDTSVNARMRAPLRFTALLLAALSLGATTRPLAAQGTLLFTEDAAPVPQGMLRFRVIPGWERSSERFTGSGSETRPLGAIRSSAAFGASELPALRPIEGALQVLTGDANFRLSLGAATTTASTRTVVMPLMVEYGLTSRITLSANLPIVRWRAQVAMRNDSTQWRTRLRMQAEGRGPTVGIVSQMQAQQLAAAQKQLETSVASLADALARCQMTPTGAGCGAINGNRTGAQALLTSITSYRDAVATLLRTPSAAFALLPGSAAAAMTARVAALNAEFRGFLGADALTAPLPLAAGRAGVGNVRDFLLDPGNPFGPDTIGYSRGMGIGDVELGARMVLVDRWLPRRSRARGDTVPVPAFGWRVSAGALARLGTGMAPSGVQFGDPGTGDGQTDVEGSALADVRIGTRFGATAVARYTAQLGEVANVGFATGANGAVTPIASAGTTRALGNVMALELSPRVYVNEAFSVDGHYGFEKRGSDTYNFAAPDSSALANWVASMDLPGYSVQRAGVGFTYSTLRAWERGMVPFPLELSWTHFESIRASAAVPKGTRDLISLRIYYRMIGR